MNYCSVKKTNYYEKMRWTVRVYAVSTEHVSDLCTMSVVKLVGLSLADLYPTWCTGGWG